MAGIKFTKNHIWARLENDGNITVGITDYAQDELDDIVFFEQPEVGTQIKSGEKSAVIESVKSASDIPSPISGKIIAINEEAVKNPAIINQDSENSGWLFKIEPSDINELETLMTHQDYEKYLDE